MGSQTMNFHKLASFMNWFVVRQVRDDVEVNAECLLGRKPHKLGMVVQVHGGLFRDGHHPAFHELQTGPTVNQYIGSGQDSVTRGKSVEEVLCDSGYQAKGRFGHIWKQNCMYN